jgi:hypothetical protein
MVLATYPFPSSTIEHYGRVELSIPLVPLCAFMAVYRVNFTFLPDRLYTE